MLLFKLIAKYLLSYCFRLTTLKAHGTMKAPAVELLKCLKWRKSQYKGTGTKNSFSKVRQAPPRPFYVEDPPVLFCFCSSELKIHRDSLATSSSDFPAISGAGYTFFRIWHWPRVPLRIRSFRRWTLLARFGFLWV